MAVVFADKTVDSQEKLTLQLNTPVDRQISEGQTHVYSIRASMGEFFHVVVNHPTVSLVATLISPDGTKLIEENVGKTEEPSWLSHTAAADGDFTIELRGPKKGDTPCRYEITLTEKRPAMPQDEQRLAGQRAFIEGSKLLTERATDTRRKAIDLLKGALDLFRKQSRQTEEARTLTLLGRGFGLINDWEAAVAHYGGALAIYRQLKDRPSEGFTLSALGNAHFATSKYDEAIRTFEQALTIWREVQNRVGEGTMLNSLGTCFLRQGKFERAVEYYDQALAISRETNDRAGEGRVLNNLGIANRSMSRVEKAIEFFESALTIKREEKDRAGEAGTLNNIGNAYLFLSRYDKAIEYYERSLPIRREVNDRVGEGTTSNNLGIAHESLGKYDKSIGFYEKALEISRETKDRGGESRVVNNLGNIHRALGNHKPAIDYYERSLAIARDLKDRVGTGRALNNLGAIYRRLGEHGKAISYYEEALSLFRELKDQTSQAAILTNLGLAFTALGQYEKAIEFHGQALPIKRAVKDRTGEGLANNGLAHAYFSNGQYSLAAEHYARALSILREVKSRHREADSLHGMALVWEKQGNPKLAILYAKQAVKIYQAIRADIKRLDQEFQTSFLHSNEETYRKLADLLISQGRLAEAEKVLELLKDEEFNRIVRRRGPSDSEISLTTAEANAEKMIDQLAVLAAERGTLLEKIENKTASGQDRARLDVIEVEITEANRSIRLVLAEVSKSSADALLVTQQSQAMMQSLRRLGPGVVALYTVIANNKGWVILTTPDFRRAYPIDVVELSQTISDFRLTLKSDRYDPLPLARKLYAALFLQRNEHGVTLASDLKSYRARTLMWSLDGVLRYVPVGALHDGNGYLLERYTNLVFTSASLTRLLDRTEREWSGLGLGVSREHQGFVPLPSVPRELQSIIREKDVADTGGVLPGVIRLDEGFTRKTLIDGLREGYPIVHIASHFRFNPEREELSFLLLGDGSHLSLEEMQDQPGIFERVELLTLSACDTATVGSNGKETEGLAFVAQDLGAKAVVASLWPVADEGTEVLMREFYRLRRENRSWSKAEALKQAQLALLKGRITSSETATDQQRGPSVTDVQRGMRIYKRQTMASYAHPHFWAPFIMIGNWK
jgi:CHAT domain-containing protein/Tfp pilus assembly protein PilF